MVDKVIDVILDRRARPVYRILYKKITMPPCLVAPTACWGCTEQGFSERGERKEKRKRRTRGSSDSSNTNTNSSNRNRRKRRTT